MCGCGEPDISLFEEIEGTELHGVEQEEDCQKKQETKLKVKGVGAARLACERKSSAQTDAEREGRA